MVEQLQGAFAENWLEATGVALGGPTTSRGRSRPRARWRPRSCAARRRGAASRCTPCSCSRCPSARRSIYITNPYFVPDEKMIETLIQAPRRGRPGGAAAARRHRPQPRAPGEPLRARAAPQGGDRDLRVPAALLHAKTMVIDSIWATVGSTNLDRRSFALNEELNLVIYDAGVARRLEQRVRGGPVGVRRRDVQALGQPRTHEPVTRNSWRCRSATSCDWRAVVRWSHGDPRDSPRRRAPGLPGSTAPRTGHRAAPRPPPLPPPPPRPPRRAAAAPDPGGPASTRRHRWPRTPSGGSRGLDTWATPTRTSIPRTAAPPTGRVCTRW